MISLNLHFTELSAPFKIDLYTSEACYTLVVTDKALQQVVMFFDSHEAALKVGKALVEALNASFREIDNNGTAHDIGS